MNELDKRIAELKGYAVLGMASTDPLWEPDPKKYNLALKRLSDGEVKIQEHWSTSDAKAFELVDELADAYFFIERFGLERKTWKAIFGFRRNPDGTFPMGDHRNCFDAAGEASTRPEAICRAYIAAREWMAGKEKRG